MDPITTMPNRDIFQVSRYRISMDLCAGLRRIWSGNALSTATIRLFIEYRPPHSIECEYAKWVFDIILLP